MNDPTYLKRRAAQEAELASGAADRRAAAAHAAIALAYFRKVAALAACEEQQLAQERPSQL